MPHFGTCLLYDDPDPNPTALKLISRLKVDVSLSSDFENYKQHVLIGSFDDLLQKNDRKIEESNLKTADYKETFRK